MLLHHLHRGEGGSRTESAGASRENASTAPTHVILLHGLFGSAANLGMVARGLATEFSVYSLDLPNHGQSPRSDTMSYRDMAADVAGGNAAPFDRRVGGQ